MPTSACMLAMHHCNSPCSMYHHRSKRCLAFGPLHTSLSNVRISLTTCLHYNCSLKASKGRQQQLGDNHQTHLLCSACSAAGKIPCCRPLALAWRHLDDIRIQNANLLMIAQQRLLYYSHSTEPSFAGQSCYCSPSAHSQHTLLSIQLLVCSHKGRCVQT